MRNHKIGVINSKTATEHTHDNHSTDHDHDNNNHHMHNNSTHIHMHSNIKHIHMHFVFFFFLKTRVEKGYVNSS